MHLGHRKYSGNCTRYVHHVLVVGFGAFHVHVLARSVNDHLLNHKVLVVVRGHDALVVAGQLGGRPDDVQSPVLGQRVVGGRSKAQPDVVFQRTDGPWWLSLYPLVRRTGAIVEIPRDHQPLGLFRFHLVHAVQYDVLGTVQHSTRHSLVRYRNAVYDRVERDRARVEQRVQAQEQLGGHRWPDHG